MGERPSIQGFFDIKDVILRVEAVLQYFDKVVATLKEESMIYDKGKIVVIEEKDKGKSPMIEERPTYQPPNKVQFFTMRKSIMRKQLTISTPTQSEESRASSP